MRWEWCTFADERVHVDVGAWEERHENVAEEEHSRNLERVQFLRGRSAVKMCQLTFEIPYFFNLKYG